MDITNTQNQGQGMASAPSSGPSATRSVDVSKFTRFINWCFYALVLILPLIYLPLTSEVREFNKQSILFGFVVLMLAVWVIKILTTRSVSWVKTSLDFALLGYVVIYLISSFMSIDQPSSFLGYYGRFTGSFISIFSLVVLYYLIVNNVKTSHVGNKIMNMLILSGGLVMIYSFLQLIGVYIIRFDFAKTASFNPIGGLAGLAMFSAIMLILIQWSWLTTDGLSKIKRFKYGILTLVGLAIIYLVNSLFAWVTLGVGLMAFLALAIVMYVNKNTAVTWFWRPLLVLVVAVLFIAFNFLPANNHPRNLVSRDLIPVEIQLSASANFDMVKNALSNKPVLGYGPGTTGIAFGEIKPPSINKSVVWSLNFDRASSEIANIAIETGLLGLLAFEAISIMFLLYALFFLLRKPDHPGRQLAFGFFLLWLTLYVMHFYQFFNTTFYFMFWLAIGMFMAITHWHSNRAEESTGTFADSPRSALSWMFASLLILAVLLVGAFFQASVYLAETAYSSGVRELNKAEPDFNRANDHFANAITRNEYRDVYYLGYAQNLVFLASLEAAKEDPNVQQFTSWIGQLVNAANQATNVSPNKASNWSARAQFYTQLRPLSIQGTNEAIVDSWERAAGRDPSNPTIQVRLAQAYSTASETIDPRITGAAGDPDSDNDGLTDARETELGSNLQNSDSNNNGVDDGTEVASGFNPAGPGRLTQTQLTGFIRVDEAMLQKAETALKKAIELKDDLPDSYVVLARVYEKWGRLDQAIEQLNIADSLFRNSPDIKFELGRVTFNQRNIVEAKRIFRDVLRLSPDHANATYSLGLIALQEGDQQAALDYFERAREITGPNVDLERLINELSAQLNPETNTDTPPETE